METNTDRGIWSIVVIIVGIVIAASLIMLAPGYFSGLNDKYQDEVIGSIKKEPTDEEILENKILIVTFDSNEGTDVPSQEVKYRAQTEIPDTPTREGYTFNQWSPDIDMQIIRDTMFTAKWDLNVYDVKFNTGPGATVVPSQKVKHGDKALRPSDPTNEGYDFLGWEPSISADIKADTEFKAQWELTKHNVSFANTGDSTVPSQQVTHGFITALPGDPQMAGHDFKGWSPEIGQAITKDTVFTAEWTGNWYDVTFDTGEGATKIPQTTVLYGKTVDKPANPTKEGYQFVGWSPEITSPIKKDTLFIAEWKANVYNVTFNTTGGTPTPAAQKISYGERASTPISPTKYGYVFDGWSPSIEDTDIRKDTVFSAKWKTDQFKVMFDSNGGSQGTSTQYVDYQKAPSNPGNPTRVGYEFVRWNPAITTKITKDTTFTAEWRIKSYQVNFDTGGGTSIPSQTVAHGSNITIPDNPTRSGSKFLGWDGNLTEEITTDLVYIALWDVEEYEVNFLFDGGLLKDTTFGNATFSTTTQSVAHGSKPLDPFADLPTGLEMIPKPGHKFIGWSPSLNTVIKSAGKEFTAQWTPDCILATDDDFSGTSDGNFRYIGTDKAVCIPHVIKGVSVTSYRNMFNTDNGKLVEKVISDNDNVTNMSSMFGGSLATSLDLSSFDTSNVTSMSSMFYKSRATTLDLSSFDTSNVTSVSYMFSGSSATTGYARTQTDADRFNASSGKPARLAFYAPATDDDFSGISDGTFKYIGTSEYVLIPNKIKGVPVISYSKM